MISFDQQKDTNIKVTRTYIPCISFKLNGQLVETRQPSILPGTQDWEEVSEGQGDDDGGSSLPNNVRDLVTKALNDTKSAKEKLSPEPASDADACNNQGDATDDEDAPDWFFDIHETQSMDPEYEFCPAAHRKQLLNIMT